MKFVLKNIFIAVFYCFVFFPTFSIGQSHISESDSAKTDDVKYRIFKLKTNYGSNMLFLGRQSNQKYPYVSSSAYYKTAVGIWASSTAYHLLDLNVPVAETDISAGWDFNLSKKIDCSLNYSHYFYDTRNPIVKSVVTNDAQIYLGYEWWKAFYTSISADYLFGNISDYYISFQNSRYFEFDSIFHTSHIFSFEPMFGIYTGPQNYSSKYYKGTTKSLKLTDKNVSGKGKGKGGASTGGGNTSSVAGSLFNVIYYEVGVPFIYTIGKFSFKFNFYYAIPVNNLQGDNSKAQAYYIFGLQYRLEKEK